MFKRNTLKQQYKHRLLWKCVLRQSCHLMALHSIELQWFTFYFPLKHNMEMFYWARQCMSTCRETTSNTAFGSNGKHCSRVQGIWEATWNSGFMKSTSSWALLSHQLCCQELPLAEQNDRQHFVTGNTAGACILRNDMGNVFVHSKGNIRIQPTVEQ